MTGYVHNGQYDFISNSEVEVTITKDTQTGQIDVGGDMVYSGGTYDFSGLATLQGHVYNGVTDITVDGKTTPLLFAVSDNFQNMSAEFGQTVFVASTSGASYTNGKNKFEEFLKNSQTRLSISPEISSSNARVDAQKSTGAAGTYQQVVAPYTLSRNSSQLYTFRVWLDDNSYSDSGVNGYYTTYNVVEGQWFGSTSDPNNQVYATSVYPNPSYQTSSPWSFQIGYYGFGVSYTYQTVRNTYSNNGTNWFIDQFYGNNFDEYATQEVYESNSDANGLIASVSLYAGENATLGVQKESSEQDISIEEETGDVNDNIGPTTDYFWLYNTVAFPVDVVN